MRVLTSIRLPGRRRSSMPCRRGKGASESGSTGKRSISRGKDVDLDYFGARLVLPLTKGWNRLLILNARTIATRKTWWISASVYGDGKAEYETQGISWMTPIPSPGVQCSGDHGGSAFLHGRERQPVLRQQGGWEDPLGSDRLTTATLSRMKSARRRPMRLWNSIRLLRESGRWMNRMLSCHGRCQCWRRTGAASLRSSSLRRW